MSNDGMLLNFDITNFLPKPAITFKGGSWRDRTRAKRSAAAVGVHPLAASWVDDPSSATVHINDNERPLKRTKTSEQERTILPAQSSSKSSTDARRLGSNAKHVTSRLFTSNPLPVTDIDAAVANAAWDAPAPSNVPASDAPEFSALGILSRLSAELARENLSRPTPIQRVVLSHLLTSDADVFVQAETGSGKTLAYLLPILNRVLSVSSSNDATTTSDSGGATARDPSRNGPTHLHRDSGLFAVVVTPTRELARQTYAVLARFLRPFPWLVATAITGGESKKAEKARIRKGVNFLIATPGRLADHLENTRTLSFRTVRWLILDEGDRLMELGFEEDLRKVVTCMRRVEISPVTRDGAVSLKSALPARRVTVLCSATMKTDVQRLGEMSLADAVLLEVNNETEEARMREEVKHSGEGRTGEDDQTQTQTQTQTVSVISHKAPTQLRQMFVVVPAKLRLVTLVSQLRSVLAHKYETTKIIVFISCADSVDFHFEILKLAPLDSDSSNPIITSTAAKAAYLTTAASSNVSIFRLHGSLTQQVRTATLAAFTSSTEPAVLLATDIASRGLDIPSVDLVIEYDPAFCLADHIHRVGRTARAGRQGDATLFLQPGCEEGYLGPLRTSAVAPPIAQSYEHLLRKGLADLNEYPFETHAHPPEASGEAWSQRAEALQLHLEQRLLGRASSLLETARAGFRAHVRAYATHVKDERKFFDLGALHLGHLAKSYGLREAPAGIGMGLGRKLPGRNKKGPKGMDKGRTKGNEAQKGGKNRMTDGTSGGFDADDTRAGREAVLKKGRMLGGADEFNLG